MPKQVQVEKRPESDGDAGASPEARAAALWDHLTRVHVLVAREAGRSLRRQGTLARVAILDRLARRKEGLSPRELAEATGIPTGSLRSLVERLAGEGLVGQGDERVKLTAKGARAASDLVERHRRDLAEILRAVPEGDLDQLRRLLESAACHLEARFLRSRRGGR